MDLSAQDLVSSGKDVVGHDAETAVPVVHQPIAGMTGEFRDLVGELYFEGLLHLQRQNVVREAHVTAGSIGDGRRDGPVFMRELAMRYTPLMTAVAGQYGIAGMRV